MIKSLWLTFAVCAVAANGATITYDLRCVLNGNVPANCASNPSFGTVSISDIVNGVSVTVDLAGTGQKFRDLMLNAGSAVTITNDGDPNNVVQYSSNGFSITPYSGLFDIGGSGGQGWAGNDGYTTNLTGTGLTVANLATRDSLNNVYVALHIQSIGPGGCSGNDNGTTNCVPGQTGGGSLKIGGILSQQNEPPTSLPEPGSMTMIGSGILGFAYALRRVRR